MMWHWKNIISSVFAGNDKRFFSEILPIKELAAFMLI